MRWVTSEPVPKAKMNSYVNKSLFYCRPLDNSTKQDNSESAFQVVGYRKGGKVLHEHWV